MGWMEILAALQKAVPLLTRAVPMLEVFVASRNNTAANDEMKASLAGLNAELARTSSNSRELADAVAANGERLTILAADQARLRSAVEEQTRRSGEAQAQIAALARTLRLLFVATGLVVLLCIGIILTLLMRHS